MRTHTLRSELWLPRPPDVVFPFFADARNLEAITPPFLRFSVLTPMPLEMGSGVLIDYRLVLHRVPIRWRTRISAWEPCVRFVDEQLHGPYRLWRHEHLFIPERGGTRCVDLVTYAVPGGPVLERLVEKIFVRRDVERIFEYRRARLLELLGTPNAVARESTRPVVSGTVGS